MGEHISYTETYDMGVSFAFSDLGLMGPIEQELRDALDGEHAPEIRGEIEREITAEIREHGVYIGTGEWLGEWSAEDIVRAALDRPRD